MHLSTLRRMSLGLALCVTSRMAADRNVGRPPHRCGDDA